MRKKLTMPRRRAFTLIELLVVVAVIALLMAILLPTLGKAKTLARTTKCLANTRALSTTVSVYLAEWRRMMPYVNSFTNPGAQWTQALRTNGYGAIDNARLCPEASVANQTASTPWFGTAHFAWGASPETGPDPITGKQLISSYGLNAFVYAYTSDMSGIGGAAGENYSLPNVKLDSDVPLWVDCTWRHMTPHSGDRNSGTLEDPGVQNMAGTLPLSYAILNRHNMAVNISFLDGHASTVKLRDLYTIKWSNGWQTPSSIPPIPTK